MNYVSMTTMKGLEIAKAYALQEVIGLSEKDIYALEYDTAAINVSVKFTDSQGNYKSVTVSTLEETAPHFVIKKD